MGRCKQNIIRRKPRSGEKYTRACTTHNSNIERSTPVLQEQHCRHTMSSHVRFLSWSLDRFWPYRRILQNSSASMGGGNISMLMETTETQVYQERFDLPSVVLNQSLECMHPKDSGPSFPVRPFTSTNPSLSSRMLRTPENEVL